ncbi:MAG: bifunctional diaminohydroxyphosphoribosylaminopyrimidine deaminase/5-amino-6-(5-phosphoribosylamino)uracil reductase RibD [Candidatus Sulfotelmatobacter sp.]
MFDPSTEDQFLHQVLTLARQGMALASPNPYVGAMIVDGRGTIVGTGAYTYHGLKHAEVIALEQAGKKARGSTLYINLEPHSHQGRTPPCTDALIAAGIHRVVASMPDPNPKVSGRGFEKLRAAGVHVEVGRMGAEARRLNEAFARYIRHGVPLVTLKAAMTLDGKIALPPGTEAKREAGTPAGGWITGEAARAHVHEQRHQSDAIMVGVGTILADDPLLTDRSGHPRRQRLLRVVLDSHLRLPLKSRVVQSVAPEGAKNDVLVLCSLAEKKKKTDLEARGIRVEQLPSASDGRPDIHSILRLLGQLEVTSLMIEGGATINGMALASGIVDKVFFYYAPKILASEGSVSFAKGDRSRHTEEGLLVKHLQLHRFGNDVALEGYLRNPYEE